MRILAALLVLVSFAGAEELPPAPELLQRSIAYHDPDGLLMQSAVRLTIEGSNADGTTQQRVCEIDYRDYSFRMVQTMSDGTVLERFTRDGACGGTLDGAEPTPEQVVEHRLDCDRAKMYRDYISYLWALPMKLQDEGTLLDPMVQHTRFQDHDVLELLVHYDPEVGNETWHFYLDPDDAHLVGYAFEKPDGNAEYIVLSDELQWSTVRLPARRAWYHTGDDRYLGTDLLTKLEPAES